MRSVLRLLLVAGRDACSPSLKRALGDLGWPMLPSASPVPVRELSPDGNPRPTDSSERGIPGSLHKLGSCVLAVPSEVPPSSALDHSARRVLLRSSTLGRNPKGFRP